MVTPDELARLLGIGITQAQPRQEAMPQDQIHTARLKMKNPENFDGKTTTPFNQWWESVTMFLGFYPNTGDRQKIAWIGTLLADTALVWHLQRFRDLGDQDTWVNYAAAIRAEYRNEREAADAQLKLGQLKYHRSIRTYLPEFRALNNFAQATGEGLREKIDMAMPDSILDMRFNQNPDDFLDDEPFLQATYRAGVQVEKKKALKQAREAMKSAGNPPPKEGRKEERKGNTREPRLTAPEATVTTQRERPGRNNEYGLPNHWTTEEAALRGVPDKELKEHRANRGCHRCGRPNHRAAKCYAGATNKGTPLPQAPWKVSAGTKRRREEEDRETDDEPSQPAQKQQKVGAVETMEISQLDPWDEDSDF